MKKLIKTLLAFLLAAAIIAAGIAVYYLFQGYGMYIDAVDASPMEDKIQNIQAQNDFVPYSEMPMFYITAVVAVEDRRFFDHGGVDFISIARAVIVDVQTKSAREGGSTLTQQVAKNMYFTQEKKLERKFAEGFAAAKLETICSKTEIFELYANSIYFGSGYYGLSEAAMGYYGKKPSELTEYECAMLAGLPNAPSAYSPDTSPELAVQRTAKVIRSMADSGYIDEAKAAELIAVGESYLGE